MQTVSAAQILDSALQLADVCGWETPATCSIVAADLGVDLHSIAAHYREKDQLVEGLVRPRPIRPCCSARKTPELMSLSPAKRLEELLIAWLDCLGATPRRDGAKCCCTKLEPGHLHLQVLGFAAHQPDRAMVARGPHSARPCTCPRIVEERPAHGGVPCAVFSPLAAPSRERLRRPARHAAQPTALAGHCWFLLR